MNLMTVQRTKFVICPTLAFDKERLLELLDSFIGDREGIFEIRDNGDIQDTETGHILGQVCTTYGLYDEYLSIRSYIGNNHRSCYHKPQLKEVNAPIREAYLDKKVQDIIDKVLEDDTYECIRSRHEDND